MDNLVAMPVIRQIMEKPQSTQIRQVEHATTQWEARAQKSREQQQQEKMVGATKAMRTTETNTTESEATWHASGSPSTGPRKLAQRGLSCAKFVLQVVRNSTRCHAQ